MKNYIKNTKNNQHRSIKRGAIKQTVKKEIDKAVIAWNEWQKKNDEMPCGCWCHKKAFVNKVKASKKGLNTVCPYCDEKSIKRPK